MTAYELFVRSILKIESESHRQGVDLNSVDAYTPAS
jgi:hypothetical protein